jgi:hypothetical protein
MKANPQDLPPQIGGKGRLDMRQQLRAQAPCLSRNLSHYGVNAIGGSAGHETDKQGGGGFLGRSLQVISIQFSVNGPESMSEIGPSKQQKGRVLTRPFRHILQMRTKFFPAVLQQTTVNTR